jgi:hypothetical protein
MTEEQVMQLMTDMGLHEGGMENWVIDNAYFRLANLVAKKQRDHIIKLVDQYDGWIADRIREDAGETVEKLPDVDRAALLRELLPEIQKVFNLTYKEPHATKPT